ncbi:MAG TPA: zeta toxin family protein, partial [Terricaulis sp.]|nr:zeta toxin family protein [Terricaulis sp.]
GDHYRTRLTHTLEVSQIARTIATPGLTQIEIDARAARAMLQQIATLTSAGADFVIESTLASLTYAAKIPGWQAAGYRVILFYLRLPGVEASIARVKRRVAAGGHDIPEVIIRRRFAKSLNYLENRYKPIVDEWYVWDSLEGSFSLAEASATHG